MDCPAEDSRARWFWSHSVLIAVVSSTAVGTVATLLCIPMSAVAVLVDVMSSIVLSSIINEVFLDGYRFFPSRGQSLMKGNLPLITGWLDALFCGRPSTSRG